MIYSLRPLSDVDGGLICSSDNSFGFHAVILLLLPTVLKHYGLVEKLNNSVFYHLQLDFCHRNNLIQTLEALLFYLAHSFIQLLLLLLLFLLKYIAINIFFWNKDNLVDKQSCNHLIDPKQFFFKYFCMFLYDH